MDTRTLKLNNKYREMYFDTRGGGKHIVTGEFCEGDIAQELVKRYNAYPELVAKLEGLLAQLDGPVMVHGDGRGRDGTKTGLSGQEFNTLRDNRLAAARALLTSLNA